MSDRPHVDRSGPGRRDYDGVCILHDPTIANCREDRAETKESLEALWKRIDGMVTWKVFAFLIPIAILIAGAGFGYFGSSLGKLSDNVSDLKTMTGTLVYRVDKLEEKIMKQLP